MYASCSPQPCSSRDSLLEAWCGNNLQVHLYCCSQTVALVHCAALVFDDILMRSKHVSTPKVAIRRQDRLTSSPSGSYSTNAARFAALQNSAGVRKPPLWFGRYQRACMYLLVVPSSWVKAGRPKPVAADPLTGAARLIVNQAYWRGVLAPSPTPPSTLPRPLPVQLTECDQQPLSPVCSRAQAAPCLSYW
jgi:hypothetical protein